VSRVSYRICQSNMNSGSIPVVSYAADTHDCASVRHVFANSSVLSAPSSFNFSPDMASDNAGMESILLTCLTTCRSRYM
jgi:hypothetical protein